MVYKKVKTVTYTITAGVALCDPVGIFSIDVSIGGCDFGLERASSVAANEELALEKCMADWHLCYESYGYPMTVKRKIAIELPDRYRDPEDGRMSLHQDRYFTISVNDDWALDDKSRVYDRDGKWIR